MRQAAVGVAPSLREIAKEFGFRSMTAAADHIRALRRKGVLIHHPRIARAHTLAPGFASPHGAPIAVPLLRPIAPQSAGERECTLGLIHVDREYVVSSHPEALVAFEVRGNSMSGRHIVEGDIAILDGTRMPILGDVVAVELDGEYVLKTYVVADNEPCLRADNPEIVELIPAEGRRIRGVLVGLLRRFGVNQHAH